MARGFVGVYAAGRFLIMSLRSRSMKGIVTLKRRGDAALAKVGGYLGGKEDANSAARRTQRSKASWRW